MAHGTDADDHRPGAVIYVEHFDEVTRGQFLRLERRLGLVGMGLVVVAFVMVIWRLWRMGLGG